MGNLLGSPITTKDTHTGRTHVTPDTDGDVVSLPYGISSMQGWRIHMEDAHIVQPFLFAEKRGEQTTEKKTYIQIPLPNHSLFAVFDGHGGTFAAEYASKNLLRILSRQKAFIAYAERWKGRSDYFKKLNRGGEISIDTTSEEQPMNDKERLHQLLERGRQSDEKVKQIKEKVKRHLDGEDVSCEEEESNIGADDAKTDKSSEVRIAMAAYDQELLTLLEYALCDAFCDVDAEILREVRGMGNPDANQIYGMGYCPDGGANAGIGHLPKEADPETEKEETFDKDDNEVDADHDHSTDNKPPPSLDEEDSGTTAIVVMLTPKWIVCANSGDSRAIYSRSGHRAVPLSYDHKPEDEDEERRIREAGGYVSGGRVEGDLAVSRGLGDFRFKNMDIVLGGSRGENKDRKNSILDNIEDISQDGTDLLFDGKPSTQKVSPVPDIIVQNRNEEEDEFIVMACDGIWDVQTNQECVQMVSDIFAEGESDIGLVCEEILDLCLIKGSKDNMTAAVIKFPKETIGSGGGVNARRERRAATDTNESGEAAISSGGLPRSHTPNPYVPKQPSEEDDGMPL